MNKFLKVLILLSFVAIFTACSDDTTEPTEVEPGTMKVNDQTITQNRIIIESATFEKDGWIVVHADNNGAPVVPGIISEPVLVKAGTNTNIMVPLTSGANMLDGATQVWIMLHTDDGASGSYDFDGVNGLDSPLTNLAGEVIIKPIKVSPATITISDQTVTNSVTVTVNAATDGWIVIHNQKSDGSIVLPGIIGKKAIKKGANNNVVVNLDEGVIITKGQKLFPMVHIDNDPKGEYDFPGVDVPEVFGYDMEGNAVIVVTSINAL